MHAVTWMLQHRNLQFILTPCSLSLSLSTMKTHPQKLKTTPRPLFSYGFFSHCTQTVLSPTPPPPPSSSHPPPSPTPPPPPPPPESESSSSSTTSQSFTQWKFPLSHSPTPSHHPLIPPPQPPNFKDFTSHPPPETTLRHDSPSPPPPLPPLSSTDLQEIFHVAEIRLSSGRDSDRFKAILEMERLLVPNPATVDRLDAVVPAAVMRGVVGHLREGWGAKSATKVLLALCLAKGNRRVAVEEGAAGRVVEALAELEGAAAERALAALELLCTVEEGAAEVRAHALAVPVLVEAMGRMAGRGRENAVSILAVIYGGEGGPWLAPPEEVARAVELALQGECSARGRRKGAQLLRTLLENGRSDLTDRNEE